MILLDQMRRSKRRRKKKETFVNDVVRFLVTTCFLFVFFFSNVINTQAMQPTILPDFDVLSLSGDSVQSNQLPNQGKWLLIYVIPECKPCETLLDLLLQGSPEDLLKNVVVIVGGSVEDVEWMSGKFSKLEQTEWYADPSENAYAQLDLRGVPIVLGVSQQTLEWRINGLLPNTENMTSILASWLTQ